MVNIICEQVPSCYPASGDWKINSECRSPKFIEAEMVCSAILSMLISVPQFKEKLENSMNRFFQRMKPNAPVERNNYFIQTDSSLPWSSKIGPEDSFGIGWDNANTDPDVDEIHFRSERQTLRRLPRSGGILFTIRTYFVPVKEICQEKWVPGRFASAIRSWGDDVARYKGLRAYKDVNTVSTCL
jgi:alpha-1,2-mannosyltransferase